MNIDELTIAQAREISAMFPQPLAPCIAKSAATGLDDFAVGQTVIIRTYSAGVWCGLLKQKAGNEVILENARRMWLWYCAKSISLSGVVCYGIDQGKSKIAPPVPYVWLEAIEILPISGSAMVSIMEASNAEAE